SATRGGVEATRQMLQISETCHLAVVPDGPRGPRRRLKTGVVSLAAAAGTPILPIGVGFSRAWRLGTWDRFALPYPGSAVRIVLPPTISIPAGLDREQVEVYRRLVEREMHRAAAVAEHWVETRRRVPQLTRDSAIPEGGESGTMPVSPHVRP